MYLVTLFAIRFPHRLYQPPPLCQQEQCQHQCLKSATSWRFILHRLLIALHCLFDYFVYFISTCFSLSALSFYYKRLSRTALQPDSKLVLKTGQSKNERRTGGGGSEREIGVRGGEAQRCSEKLDM